MRKVLIGRDARGMTLTEVLLATGLLGVVALGAVESSRQLAGFVQQMRVVDGAELIKRKAIDNVNSEHSWQRTVSLPQNASTLGCLSLGIDCSGAGGPFSLADVSGQLLSNHAAPPDALGSGLDLNGRPCETFNPNADVGNDACPFRLETTWEAVCTGAPCPRPEIRIRSRLLYHPTPGSRRVLNATKYALDFTRGDAVSVGSACQALKGVFDATTGTCRMPYEGRCPVGVVVGVDPATRTKICKIPYTYSCPPGNVLVGVFPDGTANCKPKDCSVWSPPTGWTDGPPTTGDGGDGGCDGADGGCGS